MKKIIMTTTLNRSNKPRLEGGKVYFVSEKLAKKLVNQKQAIFDKPVISQKRHKKITKKSN